jgi:hypothetical protein
MIVIRLHTKFHASSSKSSVIIAIKPKAKVQFSTSVILFQILQNALLIKVMYISKILPHIVLGKSQGKVPVLNQGPPREELWVNGCIVRIATYVSFLSLQSLKFPSPPCSYENLRA